MKDWVSFAKENNFTHVIIMFDGEDKDIYPIYLDKNSILEVEIKKLQLSEGKQKLIDIIKVQ